MHESNININIKSLSLVIRGQSYPPSDVSEKANKPSEHLSFNERTSSCSAQQRRRSAGGFFFLAAVFFFVFFPNQYIPKIPAGVLAAGTKQMDESVATPGRLIMGGACCYIFLVSFVLLGLVTVCNSVGPGARDAAVT